ncbi:hypothetical protein B9Z19DRAFT_1061644 [Tuber borchii]|uniref:HNH nuclease domain-containing protein n=1 Tax=Tuber borchii TaxID=42251 RepID=A0A2T7A4E2_TUBBO|nr:hypothetical protein B9Z19DRAFT_1061644 [Tuber borchii]
MSSHDEIISPPSTCRPARYLRPYVNQTAGPELRNVLGQTLKYMTRQLRQELLAEVSTDTNECNQAIDLWIARLNTIKSGLASFPMVIEGGEANTTTQSPATAPPADGTNQAQHASPSEETITACLERDGYQCILTGRKLSNGSDSKVVPIIPFVFANHPRCRDLAFWKMLEMFYGTEAIDTLFAGLLDRVNSLENLIALDDSIHARLNSGWLTLTPETATRDPIPVINNYRGGYWLNLGYPQGLRLSEHIQSIKGLNAGEVRTLYPRSRIAIECHKAMPNQPPTLPLPSYFALRVFVLTLKNLCAYQLPRHHALAPPGAFLTPGPITPSHYWNEYPTYSPTLDSTSADPILAASAILQALADAGALERSP